MTVQCICSAVHLYRYKTDDAILLNIVGYHLQQAVDWETLELLAPKITELETRTRYDKDFSANVKIVERVFAAARQFLDWVGEQDVQRRREAERESANINAAAIKRNDRKS